MKWPIPPISDHGSEILLLAVIATGTMILNAQAIGNGHAGEASAYTAILMAIINAIKERWTQRSVDRMGAQLGASQPLGDPPPQDAAEGAAQAAEAATDKAEQIAGPSSTKE